MDERSKVMFPASDSISQSVIWYHQFIFIDAVSPSKEDNKGVVSVARWLTMQILFSLKPIYFLLSCSIPGNSGGLPFGLQMTSSFFFCFRSRESILLPPWKLSDIVIVFLKNLINLVTRAHREEVNDINLMFIFYL